MDNVREKEAQADAAQNAGDFETAIIIWKEILEVYPRWESGYTHYKLADCYVETGQIDLAIECYNKAIALLPNEKMFSDTLASLLAARERGDI